MPQLPDDHLLWELQLQAESVAELSPSLFDLGVSGVQIINDTLCSVYVQGNADAAKQFVTQAASLGFTLQKLSHVVAQNWVQSSAELCTQKTIGALTVIPVIDSVAAQKIPSTPNNLILIPGMGFGTGHHATTSSLIDFIQQISLPKNGSQRILDMGTGSGILAIAIAKILQLPVIAIDNDADACLNAEENIRLNECEKLVTVVTGSFEDINGQFSIVIANIYAEVIAEYASDLRQALLPGGLLLLSGILEEREPLVTKNFLDFTLVKRQVESGWVSLWYSSNS